MHVTVAVARSFFDDNAVRYFRLVDDVMFARNQRCEYGVHSKDMTPRRITQADSPGENT